MTQYFNVCDDVLDWAEEFDSAGTGTLVDYPDGSATDGQTVRISTTSTSRCVWTLTAVADTAEVEIVGKVMAAAHTTQNIVACAQDDVSAYRFGITPYLGRVMLSMYAAGTNYTIGTAYPSRTFIDGGWNWIRGLVSGGRLYIRAWADGDSEPAGWDLSDVAPPVVLSPGSVGLFAYDFAVQHDCFGVGTNGDVAPLAQPVAPVPTPKAYVSGAWVPGTLRVRQADVWVPGVLKRWTGAEWV